jgi:peptide-methionine (S)-S-oxide reductase
VGYCGGELIDPTYHQLGDHTEAFEVDFDPTILSYADLLAAFWGDRDHTRPGFSRQYRAAVFAHDPVQQELANATAEAQARTGGSPITTCVEPLTRFYLAEDYHQKYRLRRETTICDELVQRYGSDAAMVNATASARINGLLGGYAAAGEVEALLPRLALSAPSEARFTARIHR